MYNSPGVERTVSYANPSVPSMNPSSMGHDTSANSRSSALDSKRRQQEQYRRELDQAVKEKELLSSHHKQNAAALNHGGSPNSDSTSPYGRDGRNTRVAPQESFAHQGRPPQTRQEPSEDVFMDNSSRNGDALSNRKQQPFPSPAPDDRAAKRRQQEEYRLLLEKQVRDAILAKQRDKEMEDKRDGRRLGGEKEYVEERLPPANTHQSGTST